MSDHTLPQSNPEPGGNSVTEAVIQDLRSREDYGIRKYGTSLQAHNGRDALVDLYQELIDATQYLKQFLMEREGVNPKEPENLLKSQVILIQDQLLLLTRVSRLLELLRLAGVFKRLEDSSLQAYWSSLEKEIRHILSLQEVS